MKQFYYPLVLLTIFSCSSIIDFDGTDDGEDISDPSHVVSLESARETIQNIIGGLPTKSGSIRQIAEEYSVNTQTLTKGPEIIAPGDSVPPFYVFNFNDNSGYALAAADDRMCPLLCLVDSGSFHVDSVLNNPGQIAMLSRIETDYKMAIGMPIIDADGNLITADEYSGNQNLNASLLKLTRNESGPTGYWVTGPTTIYSYSGTLLDTQWGQRAFFNKLMYNSLGQKCPAGCTNIALSQLMNYYGGSNYVDGYYIDWDEISTIKSFSDSGSVLGRQMLQRFLYQTALNFNANMQPDGTAMDPSLIPAYLESFGYSSGGVETGFNIYTAQPELSYSHPVLLEGWAKMISTTTLGVTTYSYSEGHEWVCDGVLTLQTKHTWIDYSSPNNNTSYYTYTYLPHCNFGWYGSCDGYYYAGEFNTSSTPYPTPHAAKKRTVQSDTTGTSGYYRYNLHMITGIRY